MRRGSYDLFSVFDHFIPGIKDMVWMILLFIVGLMIGAGVISALQVFMPDDFAMKYGTVIVYPLQRGICGKGTIGPKQFRKLEGMEHGADCQCNGSSGSIRDRAGEHVAAGNISGDKGDDGNAAERSCMDCPAVGICIRTVL